VNVFIPPRMARCSISPRRTESSPSSPEPSLALAYRGPRQSELQGTKPTTPQPTDPANHPAHHRSEPRRGPAGAEPRRGRQAFAAKSGRSPPPQAVAGGHSRRRPAGRGEAPPTRTNPGARPRPSDRQQPRSTTPPRTRTLCQTDHARPDQDHRLPPTHRQDAPTIPTRTP